MTPPYQNTQIILVHAEEDLKTVKCNLCGKAYLRNCDMTFHLKGFGKRQLNANTALSISFKTKGRLESHEITHQQADTTCTKLQSGFG